MKMKQLLMAALLLVTGTGVAQNALTVDDFLLPQNGGVISMTLTLDAANKYTSYQFKIVTPTGAGYVTDDEGDVDCELGIGHDVTHGATAHWNASEKILTIGVASTNTSLFNGQTVELQIPVAETTAAIGTDFDFTVKDIAFIDKNGVKSFLDNVSFTATVGDPEEKRIVLNETFTSAPTASNGAVDVLVKRTIKAGEWSTICLPFAMTAAQVTTAFGTDVQLANFTGYDTVEDADENVVGITVHFTPVTAIEANHPYVIKVSSPITEFTADDVTIAPEEEPCVEYDNGLSGKKRVVWGSFTGTYVADFEIPYSGDDASLFLSGNKMYYASAQTQHMKAYRAYFWFIDILPESSAASARISMSFDEEGEATRILSPSLSQGDETWFDLSGRKLEGEPIEKGVYIHNGNKELKK